MSPPVPGHTKPAGSRRAARQVPTVALVALALLAACAGAAAPPGKSPLTAESQAVYEKRVRPFLQKYCAKCHDEDSAKAGFRIDDLGTDFLSGKTADRWREAIDQINLGKMPKSKTKPDPREAFAVVEWVNQELRNAEKRAQSSGGRVPMRRLNRTEYANTVRDLFHLDDNLVRKIEQELPADGKVDGFDRGGAALFVDKSQLQAYLDVAELVMREALPAAPIKSNTYRIRAADDFWLLRRNRYPTSMDEVLDRGDVKFADLLAHEQRPLPPVERGPEPNDLIVWRDNGLEIYTAPFNHLGYTNEGRMLQKVVTRDGWYRFRIRAGASRGRGKYAVDAVRVQAHYCPQSREQRRSFAFTIDAPLDRPQVYEQTVFLRRGGAGFRPSLAFRWNMYHGGWRGFHDDDTAMLLTNPDMRRLYWAGRQSGFEYSRALETKQPPAVVAAARKKRDDALQNLYKFARTFRGPVNRLNPIINANDVPHLWYEYIEVEGPLTEWPTKASRELFFQGTEREGTDYARRIFTRFLPRAYRRPVKPEEVERLVKLVETMQEKHGKTFVEAVRAAVAGVLVSPDFLYLQEPVEADAKPRALNDYELASRLSYFLWSTMPDRELFDLAARQQLRAPGALRAQVQRMLKDPRARQFVENFVGQWMRVREFDSVMVDRGQYRSYDDDLRDSGSREPYEFFNELLRANESVLNVLDSDFLVINERLAKHYGIDGVEGENFRRVALRPEHRRGGITGMAGLLTYLADGTRTLPVRRGAYLLDVLWNTPAALPPPNAGDLPVIKKKNLTVRQRLELHRSVPFCASCHTRIDPLGLALENYDAIGAWRERQNGEGRRGGKYDPPIDPSGVMPGGQSFRTLPEFKHLLLADKDKFLKGFTEKLLAYALGRPVGAADRQLVQTILGEAAREEYRLQAMLQALVATRAFQSR